MSLALLISLHYILRSTHESYSQDTSVANILDKLGLSKNNTKDKSAVSSFPLVGSQLSDVLVPSPQPVVDHDFLYPQRGTANAVFVFLARNSDLEGVVSSVRQMEDRFNRNYNYPWVFLNDEPFTEEFIRRVRLLTNAKIQFGLIPAENWHQPDWIDEQRAEEGRNKMVEKNIIYGGSVPYRNMCRFNSGFFYRHELLKPYRYYWRVEPHVKYFCDLNYDPFTFMQENNKTYGFTLSMLEYYDTIPTLWNTVHEFTFKYPQYVAKDNSLGFLSDTGGWTYNLCHFWSNFEIADMDFWRGEAYSTFFEFLDQTGGFYYERWGDAPVHSIAAGLFASKDQIHFFKDIGYQHDSFGHCPQGKEWEVGRCSCNPYDTFDYTPFSCLSKWENLFR